MRVRRSFSGTIERTWCSWRGRMVVAVRVVKRTVRTHHDAGAILVHHLSFQFSQDVTQLTKYLHHSEEHERVLIQCQVHFHESRDDFDEYLRISYDVFADEWDETLRDLDHFVVVKIVDVPIVDVTPWLDVGQPKLQNIEKWCVKGPSWYDRFHKWINSYVQEWLCLLTEHRERRMVLLVSITKEIKLFYENPN